MGLFQGYTIISKEQFASAQNFVPEKLFSLCPKSDILEPIYLLSIWGLRH